MLTSIHIMFIFIAMIVIYELICPLTQGVVYVGMTKDIKTRYFAHIWGSNSDSEDSKMER